MRKFVGLALVVVFGLMSPKPASAGPLVDGAELDFDGSVRITLAGLIDWIPPVGGGNGIAIIQPTSTLSFAALAGTIVTETDLNQAAFPAGPVGSFAPLPFFEVLAAQPTTNFTLLAINLCTAPFCAAGPLSPFNFIELPDGQGGTNTTVILSMFGIVTDPVLNPGQVFTWTGTWSADFENQTAAQILAELQTNGFIEAPYSAAKVALSQQVPVPEPATLLTFGAGSALLALRRRRANKAAARA